MKIVFINGTYESCSGTWGDFYEISEDDPFWLSIKDKKPGKWIYVEDYDEITRLQELPIIDPPCMVDHYIGVWTD